MTAALAFAVPELPAGLAEPLHYRPAEGLPWLWIALWCLLGLWALIRLMRWLRNRGRARPAPAAVPAPPAAAEPAWPAVAERIREIHVHYRRKLRYREGCHRLSALLRELLEEGSLGRPVEGGSRMTAREVGRRLGERPFTRLLGLLSELQFGRKSPGRGDFDGICELAVETVRKDPIEKEARA